MFLLSPTATCQVWTVSLKAGLYTYNGTGADWEKAGAFSQPLTASVRHLSVAGGKFGKESLVETAQPLPSDLVEEYKLCQQKATGLADNIWKTALESLTKRV
jgi:hypothetical protein